MLVLQLGLIIGGAGLFGSRGYSGLFYKMGDDNSVANDMSKNVERGDRGHGFPHFKQIWKIS